MYFYCTECDYVVEEDFREYKDHRWRKHGRRTPLRYGASEVAPTRRASAKPHKDPETAPATPEAESFGFEEID